MRRTIRKLSLSALALILAVGVGGAFWFGLVPNSLSPLPSINLESPGWLVDPRLASLRFDKAQCRTVLKPPHTDATPIPDNPLRKGCGWVNSVRFSQVGGARLGVNKITCEMAAALSLWIEHEVQPLAMKHFGKRVASLGNMGTYDCRDIIGNPMWKGVRSQHATANALDISGFKLEDGTSISVLRNWKGTGPKAKFLREAHQRACGYFRVALSPNFNVAHRDHFHLDRGILWSCK
jgi:hypothetical protein